MYSGLSILDSFQIFKYFSVFKKFTKTIPLFLKDETQTTGLVSSSIPTTTDILSSTTTIGTTTYIISTTTAVPIAIINICPITS